MRVELSMYFVLGITSGPRVKIVDSKSALNRSGLCYRPFQGGGPGVILVLCVCVCVCVFCVFFFLFVFFWFVFFFYYGAFHIESYLVLMSFSFSPV